MNEKRISELYVSKIEKENAILKSERDNLAYEKVKDKQEIAKLKAEKEQLTHHLYGRDKKIEQLERYLKNTQEELAIKDKENKVFNKALDFAIMDKKEYGVGKCPPSCYCPDGCLEEVCFRERKKNFLEQARGGK